MTIVIGMGGGYDIVAAYMVARSLERQCNEHQDIQIGGFLNPKFSHVYVQPDGLVKEEVAVNHVLEAYKYRWTKCNNEAQKEYFVDSSLAQMISNDVYNFSTQNLLEVVDFLDKTYNKIIFCDVGGDVLFSGRRDSMVKTPIIDAFSLKIASMLNKKDSSKVKIMLLGLGYDGELPYSNIKSNMDLLYKNHAILGSWNICKDDIDELEKVYYNIKQGRKGKTIQLMIDVWNGQVTDHEIYEKRRIDDFAEWHNKGYWVDPTYLSQMNPLCLERDFTSMLNAAKNLGVCMERYI
ncbi:DUF1152 domain-containing protein [Clostridium sp. YIM B02505]|uniref:DUF1152 domain-containing protein n=1 Tax=Clostridium yunnanense TaxID=2800325 RepID=A0ABS1EPP2_9CLOT|nr:DUF1152 domain-containing protein [Clostridium yunnanense]MBK1811309.1 DUF1152 domain-containing protein [Clostridium yunnanense]